MKNKQRDSKKKVTNETTKKISKSRLDKLVEVDNIEELYLMVNLLDKKKIESFIEHYKKTKLKEKSVVSRILHKVISKEELSISLQQEIINHLKDRYDNISSKISEERKKGRDIYFEWIKSMSIPLKIKLYSATFDKKDYYKVIKILDELENSLKIQKNKN